MSIEYDNYKDFIDSLNSENINESTWSDNVPFWYDIFDNIWINTN
jgi:hypothetical protein